jgi:hypothetical protein
VTRQGLKRLECADQCGALAYMTLSQPRHPSRDLTVTLTERERRILGRSLEFVEAFAPGLRFPTDEHEALRARIMDGLE